MSDSTPAPVPRSITPVGPLKAARALWLASFAAGLIAIVFVFLERVTQLERLRGMVTDIDPDQDALTLEAVALIVFSSSLGLLALMIVVEAILLRVMMRRHGAARWGLLVMLAIHVGTAVVADALIVTPGAEGLYLRALLAAQLLLAGAGLVVSFLPGARAWFRTKHEARRPPSG